MLISGQAKKEKYASHLIPYDTNNIEPVNTKTNKITLAKVEKTITALIFSLAKNAYTSEQINTATKK